MDTLGFVLKSWFFWGLVTGLIFTGMALWGHWKTKREFGRYKRMLSDRMEIEADNYRKTKEEKERLAQENENLRVKVGIGGNNSVRDLERELEIYARAEKSMIISAPGLGAAWESAKSSAHDEILAEERGKSIPKRIFRKFFRPDSVPSNEIPGRTLLPERSSRTVTESATVHSGDRSGPGA